MPVPGFVMEALESVEVTATADNNKRSGFQLTFKIDKNSPLNGIFIFSGSSPIPILRVIVVITLGVLPQTLIDGVVTNVELKPGSNGTENYLVVTGEDLSRLMAYIDFKGIPYPAMPDFTRVTTILAKYSAFGIIPLVIPSMALDVPNPLERIPVQDCKDLCYIKDLANRVGYVFWVMPGPVPGTNYAYWGPDAKIGPLQKALAVNLDSATNVESLSFNMNNEKPKLPIVPIQEPLSKVTIPIPIPSDISPLNPPLGLIPPFPKKVEFLEGSAKKGAIEALAQGMAEASRSSDFITGQGSLNVVNYGDVLKPRRLVGVRGAGLPFDGIHYVTSVTTTISKGNVSQSFTLARNQILTNTPVVPTF